MANHEFIPPAHLVWLHQPDCHPLSVGFSLSRADLDLVHPRGYTASRPKEPAPLPSVHFNLL